MIIPEQEPEKSRFLQFVVDTCTASQRDRRALYMKRRLYYLYGQAIAKIVRFNRLKSHMPLLASFLYSADQVSYTVAAPKNSDDILVAQYLAIEDDWNENFQDCGFSLAFDQALLWALIYDTMILKPGWNDTTNTGFVELVEPSSFGVMREDLSDFSSQQAMVHSFIIDYDDAVERLLRAGKTDQIRNLQVMGGNQGDIGLPGALNQMIISATGGTNIQGNIQGEINPDYESSPTYVPRVDQPVVRFNEIWVWDSKSKDWRTFHTADAIEEAPGIVLSDSKTTIEALRKVENRDKYKSETNLFLPGENPFVPVTPYRLYNYFWGECHIEDLIPLQEWSTERLTQISEILEQQVDPAKIFSGFMGMDDERAEALGGPGTWVSDQTTGAKVDRLTPAMPEDLFREFSEIGNLFMEQSGFTEILAGRGEKNVRGRGHAQELKTTGGGRIKKIASYLEEPLVRLGDLGLRLRAHNDDDQLKVKVGEKEIDFLPAQVLDGRKYTMRISGHSHSPLFTSETQQIAGLLFKSQSIDQEWLIRLLKPPQEANLIHSLRQRLAAKAKQQAQNPQPPPKQRPSRAQ